MGRLLRALAGRGSVWRALSSAARPTQLGALGGPCISNKHTILHDVDRALSPSSPRPPDVEVLHTAHLAYTGSRLSRFLHHRLIPLGHVLVRYTTSDGQQYVMNILGGDALERGGRMVNFGSPAEYLFGTEAFNGWCQQGGAYNRDIVGVRIERAPDGVVDALHAYYRALDMRSDIHERDPLVPDSDGTPKRKPGPTALLDAPFRARPRSPLARFELFGGRVNNFIAGHLPPVVGALLKLLRERFAARSSRGGASSDGLGFSLSVKSLVLHEERLLSAAGNCAQWTTSGLQWVGLVRRPRLVPKAALIELFEREHRLCPENVHVVVYKRVPHAARYYTEYEETRCTYVHPLYFLRNAIYADMDKFADVLVAVPEGSDVAVARRVPPSDRLRPPTYLPYVNAAWVATTAAAILGCFDGPEPVRTISASACAATWLLLNWWTY